MAKLAYVSRTEMMYDELPPEYQQECHDNMEVMRELGMDGPEVWENVVKYVYDEYNRPAYGWFRWWEE